MPKKELFVRGFASGRNRAVSVENRGGKLAAPRKIFEALIYFAVMMAILPANAHHGHDLEILKHLVDHPIVSVMETSKLLEGRAQWFGTFDRMKMNFPREFTL